MNISRKTFLSQSALFASTALLDTHWVYKRKKSLGIQLFTLREEVVKDLNNTIAQIAASGYNNVEMFGYDPKDRSFFGKTPKAIAALLSSHQLSSTSGHYLLPDMLYDTQYNWDSWKYALEDIQALRHQYIVVPWLNEQHRTMDTYKLLAERLNKAGELSKAAGIKTAYHNHNFELEKLDGRETAWQYLLTHTDPRLVYFEMDIYWVYYAKSNPIEWFKKYPGRFPLWHVKDMEAATKEMPIGQSCEVGKGIINFKELFSYQKKAGLQYAFVEQEAYRKPVFDCIKTSAAYMRKELL
jgi:sugar phosphate isomerase/epimerase